MYLFICWFLLLIMSREMENSSVVVEQVQYRNENLHCASISTINADSLEATMHKLNIDRCF